MAATEVMTVEFYDDDLIGDEFLGSLSFDIGEELRKLPLDCRNAEWHQAFPLDKVGPRSYSVASYCCACDARQHGCCGMPQHVPRRLSTLSEVI